MPDLRHHRTPRWLNTRVRIARFTLPQWLALASGCALGTLTLCLLSSLALPVLPSGVWLFARTLLSGGVAGVLCVLFYALADDRREPFLRQALTYPFRRHRFALKESRYAHPTPLPYHHAPRRPAAARGAANDGSTQPS